MTKYELYILPGKRDRSLVGSPEYVAGDVIAGMHWRTTYIMGIGNYMPSLLPVCRSLAGAPKEIIGNFDCMIDPDAEYGPGFLNGAPLTVGGKYFTVAFPPDDPSEEDGRSGLRTGSFLWDSEGNIISTFTDGMARRYGGSIKVNILHPAPDVSRRRKIQDLCIDHRGGVREKELSDLMFPDAEFTCVYTQVRGDSDACINWLCEVNGVGGVIR